MPNHYFPIIVNKHQLHLNFVTAPVTVLQREQKLAAS